MAQLSLLSHADTFNRVLGCRDTFLVEIVREGLSLAAFEPSILDRLQADIDLDGKQAKKVRIMDQIWQQEQLPRFPDWVDHLAPADFDPVPVERFELEGGRPRAVDAELLLVLIIANGVFPLTSADGYDRLVGSEAFQAVLGHRPAPKRSTVAKYLQLVSEETRALIHRALYRKVQTEGLDDFAELTADSTAIAANTKWPTDSRLIYGFLNRIHRLLERQMKYTGVPYKSKLVDRWLEQLHRLEAAISLVRPTPGARSERGRLYRELFRVADKTVAKLRELLGRRRDEIEMVCILPSQRLRVDRMLRDIDTAFDGAARTLVAARSRILSNRNVPAPEKAFSLADQDAYMIEKGDREPVVGYKPQLGRSGNGFISCFEVMPGNPADSDRLVPLVRRHAENTGASLVMVSTDDGYSSSDNLNQLAQMGVETVSFSGAKGRTVLGDDIYYADCCRLLRNDRSAVESMIFTMKHKMSLRRFCRRGLKGVTADMSEAVLAYNLWRIAYVRRQRGPCAKVTAAAG